jgi:hypothetical protein
MGLYSRESFVSGYIEFNSMDISLFIYLLICGHWGYSQSVVITNKTALNIWANHVHIDLSWKIHKNDWIVVLVHSCFKGAATLFSRNSCIIWHSFLCCWAFQLLHILPNTWMVFFPSFCFLLNFLLWNNLVYRKVSGIIQRTPMSCT